MFFCIKNESKSKNKFFHSSAKITNESKIFIHSLFRGIQMKEVKLLLFLIYILFGVYFINYGIEFYTIPEVISEFNKWIIFAGGILILFGGINYLRTSKKHKIPIFSQ